VIQLFNEEGKNVGNTNNFDLNGGQVLVADVDTNGQDGAFLRMVGNDNGVCISYVSITNPSGTQHAFVGDL